MGAEVVIRPAIVMCPTCASVLHATSFIDAHMPPPRTLGMRCLNSRCIEHGNVKRVPLERVNVEVENESAGLTD